MELEEDRLDVTEMHRAKREAAVRGEKPVPYEEAGKRLDVDAAPQCKTRKRK